MAPAAKIRNSAPTITAYAVTDMIAKRAFFVAAVRRPYIRQMKQDEPGPGSERCPQRKHGDGNKEVAEASCGSTRGAYIAHDRLQERCGPAFLPEATGPDVSIRALRTNDLRSNSRFKCGELATHAVCAFRRDFD